MPRSPSWFVSSVRAGGLRHQRPKRCVGDSGDGYVVNIPSGSADFFIRTDPESDLHVLVRVSRAEVQGHIREVGPTRHAIDECRPVASDRRVGEFIG